MSQYTEAEMQELATQLHDSFCRENHDDMCSWKWELGRYEPWKGFSHIAYMKKAEEMVRLLEISKINIPMSDVLKIVCSVSLGLRMY